MWFMLICEKRFFMFSVYNDGETDLLRDNGFFNVYENNVGWLAQLQTPFITISTIYFHQNPQSNYKQFPFENKSRWLMEATRGKNT